MSPDFNNGYEALDFLKELMKEFNFFIRFYPTNNKYLFHNDDYFLAVELVEQCQQLYFDTYNASGEKLVGICFEAALNFMENKNPSF